MSRPFFVRETEFTSKHLVLKIFGEGAGHVLDVALTADAPAAELVRFKVYFDSSGRLSHARHIRNDRNIGSVPPPRPENPSSR
jgi:hypothetical protein